MDPNTLSTIITLIFGAGAGGVVSGVITIVKNWRQGKVDNEETLIKRLDTDNKRQSELREEAESEAREYRRERDKALDDVAKLRRILLLHHPELLPEEMK